MRSPSRLKSLLALVAGLWLCLAACGGDKLAAGEGLAGAGLKPFSSNPVPNPSRNLNASLSMVRVASHDEEGGFDRVVFEFSDQLPAAHVEYQQRAIGCATGEPVPVRGSPVLEVRFEGAVAHDDQGRLTVTAREFDGPGKAVQQMKLTCDFEGELTWTLGVAGQKPFRVGALARPPRLVVDVSW